MQKAKSQYYTDKLIITVTKSVCLCLLRGFAESPTWMFHERAVWVIVRLADEMMAQRRNLKNWHSQRWQIRTQTPRFFSRSQNRNHLREYVSESHSEIGFPTERYRNCGHDALWLSKPKSFFCSWTVPSLYAKRVAFFKMKRSMWQWPHVLQAKTWPLWQWPKT